MIVNYFLILALLLLFSGLALDAGLLEWKKVQLQNVADAAALGSLYEEQRNGNAVTAGQSDASLNGFTNGQNNQTLTLTYPPTPANYSADYGTTQWTATQKVRTLFMGLVNTSWSTVSSQAIVRMPPCVYFLSSTITYPGMQLASASLKSNCSVYLYNMVVDSFATATAFEFYANGSRALSTITGSVSNAPIYGSPVQTDPLAYIASPAFALPCTYTSKVVSSATTLNPGTYCNGITITNTTVTLNPGLYIISGKFTVSGSTVNGTGLTLFMTKGGGYNYGGFNINTSTLNMSASPTGANGTVPGILVFADRNWLPVLYSGARPVDFQFQFSSVAGDGIWYISDTGIYAWQTNFTGTNYLAFVMDSLYLYGATIKPYTNFSGVTGGNPFAARGGLVE